MRVAKHFILLFAVLCLTVLALRWDLPERLFAEKEPAPYCRKTLHSKRCELLEYSRLMGGRFERRYTLVFTDSSYAYTDVGTYTLLQAGDYLVLPHTDIKKRMP